MAEKTFTFIDERLSLENLTDGRQVVKVSPGGTKILANVVNGKITYYEAEDSAGNQRSVFLVKEMSAPSTTFSLDLPFDGIWDWVCVLDELSMYCVHDSGITLPA